MSVTRKHSMLALPIVTGGNELLESISNTASVERKELEQNMKTWIGRQL